MARGGAEERDFIEVFGDLRVVTTSGEFGYSRADFLRRKLRAPSGVVHHKFARTAQDLVMYGERGADGKAGVARGRLDINALER